MIGLKNGGTCKNSGLQCLTIEQLVNIILRKDDVERQLRKEIKLLERIIRKDSLCKDIMI